jgi:DNA-binding NarL/FixJ family response regulator
VLALVVQGRSNKAIAAALRSGMSTVEFHVTNLLVRAGCESRAELVARFWTE